MIHDNAVLGANVFIQMFGHLWEKKIKKKRKIKILMDLLLIVNLVSKANKDAIILHCLPAYRSKEITDEVIDSSKSRIFDQAENRMHAQQALLSCLLSIKILANSINKGYKCIRVHLFYGKFF